MNTLGSDLLNGSIFLVLTVMLFFISKLIKELLTKYSVYEELRKGNLAASLSLTGYLLATIIVIMGALLGPAKGLKEDIVSFVGYSVLGIILLNVSRIINDKLILNRFSNRKEIVEDQNPGTGAVEFGSYIASGLVVAGSIHGEGGGVATALVYFFLCQLALILFARLYDFLTPFDVHDEIEKDNIAAGVAFGGTLAALGIILLKGSAGDFISWSYNLSNFGVEVAVSFVLLPLIRLFVDKVLLLKSDLNHEISTNHNLAMGLLEMTVAVSFAVAIYFSIDLTITI